MGARHHRRRHDETRRQIENRLGELVCNVLRQHHWIRDHIVHEFRRHGVEIAEIGDLHRRRPRGENLGAGAAGITGQVHQDIDTVIPNLANGFFQGAVA